MYFIRDRSSGEAFLCKNIVTKRGWVTMTDPELIHSFQGEQLLTTLLPGKLSYKQDAVIMISLDVFEGDVLETRDVVKYTSPAPVKKWWQFWK